MRIELITDIDSNRQRIALLLNELSSTQIPFSFRRDHLFYWWDTYKNLNNPRSGSWTKNLFKKILNPTKFIKPDKLITLLYNKRIPIIIQEHFQNQISNDKRQKPNIYDDIISLQKLFQSLLTLDIWYANCTEISQYFDSYINSSIVFKNKDAFEIKYSGRYTLSISIKSNSPSFEHIETGEVLHSEHRGSHYIFNGLKQGNYKLCR